MAKQNEKVGAKPGGFAIAVILFLFVYLIAVLLTAVAWAYCNWPKIIGPNAADDAKNAYELRLVVFVFSMGVLGACLHAMTSLATFVGNRRFLGSWVIWYLLRPFVGGALAWIVYLAFRGGLLRTDATDAINPHAFGALAALAGMFSKSVVDKLSELVDVLFRMPKGKGDDARGDKIGGSSLAILSTKPESLSEKDESTKLTIEGTGFTEGCVVEISGTNLAPKTVTPTEVVVDVPYEAFAGRTSVDVRVRLSPPDGAVSNAKTLAVTR